MIEKIFFCAECNYKYGNLISMLEVGKCRTCNAYTATESEYEVQLHGIVMVDKSRNNQLSYERQLELLKNNIAVTLKRIEAYRDGLQEEDPICEKRMQVAIGMCIGNINALTGISIREEDNGRSNSN